MIWIRRVILIFSRATMCLSFFFFFHHQDMPRYRSTLRSVRDGSLMLTCVGRMNVGTRSVQRRSLLYVAQMVISPPLFSKKRKHQQLGYDLSIWLVPAVKRCTWLIACSQPWVVTDGKREKR